jgi:hypothetical protein
VMKPQPRPTNIHPVLEAIAESACRLCEAYDSAIFLCEGERLRGADSDAFRPGNPK